MVTCIPGLGFSLPAHIRSPQARWMVNFRLLLMGYLKLLFFFLSSFTIDNVKASSWGDPDGHGQFSRLFTWFLGDCELDHGLGPGRHLNHPFIYRWFTCWILDKIGGCPLAMFEYHRVGGNDIPHRTGRCPEPVFSRTNWPFFSTDPHARSLRKVVAANCRAMKQILCRPHGEGPHLVYRPSLQGG